MDLRKKDIQKITLCAVILCFFISIGWSQKSDICKLKHKNVKVVEVVGQIKTELIATNRYDTILFDWTIDLKNTKKKFAEYCPDSLQMENHWRQRYPDVNLHYKMHSTKVTYKDSKALIYQSDCQIYGLFPNLDGSQFIVYFANAYHELIDAQTGKIITRLPDNKENMTSDECGFNRSRYFINNGRAILMESCIIMHVDGHYEEIKKSLLYLFDIKNEKTYEVILPNHIANSPFTIMISCYKFFHFLIFYRFCQI